jgi:hypothetical protein
MLRQQVPHRRVGVGPVVVQHDVQVSLRVGLGHVLEEGQELLVAVPGEGPVGDPASRNLGSEQGGRAVATVVVGPSGRPGRKAGWAGVRSRAWIWLFSSTHRTPAPSGVQVEAHDVLDLGF